MRIARILAALLLLTTVSASGWAQEIDWKRVDATLGRSATVTGEAHRYSFPRSDLNVTVDGVAIRPALALGGWAAFMPAHDSAMVMGDLVLLETEINPVVAKLIDGGIEVTAIHNHLLRATPATFYMHIEGHGDPVQLAGALRTALAQSRTPMEVPTASPASSPAPIDLDAAKLDEIMGSKGQVNGGVYQFSVPRRDPITETQKILPAAMGTANAVNFQPTGSGKAAITGDFVLTANEVNPLIKALRASDIEVTAIHSHMLTEEPRLFFVHFWANDDAVKLARGVRKALDKTAVQKS